MSLKSFSSCTSCNRRDAIYTRRYSGERLCARCFCRSIESKIRATISKHSMLRFDDRIAIGVSGGKDSMTLLRILTKLEESFPQAELVAITIDEGIDGYREEALRIAEMGCQKLGVKHLVVSFKEVFGYKLDELVEKLCGKTVFNGSLTPCAYCGVLRRQALNSAARNWGATKLATAHNLDDEAQTILLNILHGSPLRIRSATLPPSFTHPYFVSRIKPLSEILEKETVLYAYLKRIKFQNIPCPYATEALRNDIRSMLNRMEERHPGIKYTLYRSAEKLQPYIEIALKSERLESCKICGEPTANTICQPCKILEEFQRSKIQ